MLRRYLALVVAAAALIGCSGGSDPETLPTTTIPPPEIARGPMAYHVQYRVEDVPGRTVSTDDVWLRRPFDGRVESRDGAPPGGEARSTSISAFGVFASLSRGSSPLVVPVRPGAPVGDLRLDSSLADLLRAGAGEVVGTGRVLGRPCTVVRFGEPVATGVLPPPTDDSYADTCIDGHGVVLDEEWVDGGVVLRRRRAVQYRTDPPLPDEAGWFDPGSPSLPPEQGGGELVPLDPGGAAVAGTALWSLPRSPSGFRHLGRHRLQPAGALQPGSGAPMAAPSIVDVFVDGTGGFVVIQQGQRDDRGPRPGDLARPVDLRLPDATAEPGVTGNVVLGFPDAARFVAVVGTLPLDELVELAEGLAP